MPGTLGRELGPGLAEISIDAGFRETMLQKRWNLTTGEISNSIAMT